MSLEVQAQVIVDTVVAADETTVLSILCCILQSRPELAPLLVAYMVPDLTYPPLKGITEKRSTGVIKMLSHEKGYGFIDCAELHEEFHSDAFLHVKQAQSFSQGDRVSFAVAINKDGKPQAYDLSYPDDKGKGKGMGCKGGCMGDLMAKAKGKGDGGDTNPFSMMMKLMSGMKGGVDAAKGNANKGDESWNCGKGCFKGCKDDGKDGKTKNFSQGKSGTDAEVGIFVGTIKSFNLKSGYGFIECPDLRKEGIINDVFLHHQQLGEFQVGAPIEFTCYMNNKGQPQAKNLIPAQGDEKKMKWV